MIVFDLLCDAGHRFEGWFASAADFSSQQDRKLLNCPSCGSEDVERVPSATRVNVGAAEQSPQKPAGAQQGEAGAAPSAPVALAYARVLEEILKRTEDVGNQFPAEARRIFYAEAPERAIRGTASDEEHAALLEEGIPVRRIPVPPTSLN